MAWKDTLLDASFRDVTFEIENVQRGGQRAIASHEYPYTAGADLEDLNLGARRVRLQAVFYGDDYEDRLAQFISALEAPGTAYLVHPIHGNMLCMAESWEDEHEAEFEGARVTCTFLEHSTREVVFDAQAASARTDAISTEADAATDAADDALSDWMAQISSIEIPRITVLKDVFNQAKSVISKFLSVGSGIQPLLSDLDPLLYPTAYAADLVAMIDQAFQGLPFGGRNLLYSGSSTSTDSGKTDYDTTRRVLDPAQISIAPTAAAGMPTDDMLADAAVVKAHTQVYAATTIAESAAILLAGELEETRLDRAEVESVTAQTRSAIQTAIDSARTALDAEGRAHVADALAKLAWTVQDAATAVINQRPPLTERTAPVSGPARLVAHTLYGDGDRATELVRLNGLGRWLNVERGEVLHAYAE